MNKRKNIFRIIAIVLCLVFAAGVGTDFRANAATPEYKVVSNADQLLKAIEAAFSGDTIGIDSEIQLYEGVTLGDMNKSITLLRLNETAHLVLGGSHSSTIQNLTFDGNGIDAENPFIYSYQNLTVQNCIFQNSICRFREGAAMAIFDGDYTFANCTFKSNTAQWGGHIAISDAGHIIFDNCVFTGGKVTDVGGAIAVRSSGVLCELNNCTITNNQAATYGGGIYNAGRCSLSQTKLYNNTADILGSDYATENSHLYFVESVAELTPLFEADNLKPLEWEIQQSTETTVKGAKLILQDLTPSEPETPDKTEPDQPTTPEEPDTPETPDTPTESENPEQPDQPEEPDTPDENTPSDEVPDETPGEDEPGTPEEPSSPDSSTTTNTTTNTTTTTNTDSSTTTNSTTNSSSNSSTDNSTSSTDNSENTTTTDNSRYSTTSDSNNTSTVNNYYTHETRPSGGNGTVETIVVPVGSGEPIEQTIRIESSSPEGSVSGSLEGMTLNVNVNVGTDEAAVQQQPLPTSTVQSEGVSWYQAAVLCLLSAILVCVIKRR
ncbi:hypothetical protein [Gemmiger formicilis]